MNILNRKRPIDNNNESPEAKIAKTSDYMTKSFADIKLLADDVQSAVEQGLEIEELLPKNGGKKGGKCADDASTASKVLSNFIFIIAGIFALVSALQIGSFCTTSVFDILRTMFHIPNSGELFDTLKNMFFLCRDTFVYILGKSKDFAKYLLKVLIDMLKEVMKMSQDFLTTMWKYTSTVAKFAFESLKTICALSIKALSVGVIGTGIGVTTGFVSIDMTSIQSQIERVKQNLESLKTTTRVSADKAIAITGHETELKELNEKLERVKKSLDSAYTDFIQQEELDKMNVSNVDDIPAIGTSLPYAVDFAYILLSDMHTIVCYNIDGKVKAVLGVSSKVTRAIESGINTIVDVSKDIYSIPDTITYIFTMDKILNEYLPQNENVIVVKDKWSKLMEDIRAKNPDAQPITDKILTDDITQPATSTTCSIDNSSSKGPEVTSQKGYFGWLGFGKGGKKSKKSNKITKKYNKKSVKKSRKSQH